MTKKEIRKTWYNLLTPFIIGLLVFIVSLVFNQFGSKRPTPQTLSLFGCVFGLVFMIFPGRKMLKFRRYLKSNNEK